MNNLSESEINKIVEGLSNFEPGVLPQEVFLGISRLVVTPTYIVIPFYEENGEIYVYLKMRPSSDVTYPNKLNTPGKVILATDESLDKVFERLKKSELTEENIKGEPKFVEVFFDQISRGKEISLVYWIELENIINRENLYKIVDLPDKLMIDTDVPRINLAAEYFEKSRKYSTSFR